MAGSGNVLGQSPVHTPEPFFERLLTRGALEYQVGNYSAASRTLEIASFGLMETLDLYQRAQVLLSLSEQGRGNLVEARAAVRRVLQVESIAPTYPPADLDPEIQARFEATVERLLPEAELPPQGRALPPIQDETPVKSESGR
ncbi:MAG: hypothetical protein KY432_06110 [Acidobacteria bacterium]|nr:hypothetical protein [Acidobacteriota bacterium]